MSKMVKITLDLLAYEAAAETNNPADADKLHKSVYEPAVSALSRVSPLQVATGTTDQALALPGTPANYLVICTDQPISIKLNGGVTAIPLSPSAPGVKTPVFYLRGTINSVSVSNASGQMANVDVIGVKI